MAPRIDPEREEKICTVWNSLRAHATKAKEAYITQAAEVGQYYAGPNHDFVFGNAKPDFAVTVNKVYEMVSIFGPLVYAQNPRRNVEPKANGNPAMAEAMHRYLNYTPAEFGLKASSKAAIDESLINGRGCLITGQDAKTRLVMSETEATKNILLDPSEKRWYEGRYMFRLRREKPLWEIARIYGEDVAKRLMAENVIAGEGNALWSQDGSQLDALDDDEKDKTKAYDAPRVTYYEVWSKMGIGLRATKSDDMKYAMGGDSPDNIFLVYEPSKKIIMHIGGWPVPFWADVKKHSWPVSFLDPAENRDVIWPISPITPALGEQKFLDWGWSFALGAIRVSSRTLQVCHTSLDDKVRAKLAGHESHILIPIDELDPQLRKNLIQNVEMPQLNPALWEGLDRASNEFEKRTGLYEILYGQSAKQYRSATEAQIKGDYSRLRIDDVIDRAEDWQTEVARKEAIAARFLLDGEAVRHIVGDELAMAWDLYKPNDLMQAMREYGYNIEAGSMRKRTPQFKAEIAQKRMETMGPMYLSIGDLEGFNTALMEVERAVGTPNPERFKLQQVPPPEMLGAKPAEQGAAGPPAAPEVMSVEGGEPVMGMP